MFSRIITRIAVCLFKIYLMLIGFILIVSFLSRAFINHNDKELPWRQNDTHKILSWADLLKLHKNRQIYSLMENLQKSDRFYFEHRATGITAEEILNVMDFEHPSELTSLLVPNYEFLSNVYAGTTGPVRILSWTIKYFKPPGPWYPEGDAAFQSCELEPWMQCEYTHDRTYLNFSEAILFHGQHIFDLPPYRFANHKWVFWEVESPQAAWHENPHLGRLSHLFNLSSTYSLESTVPIPYIHTCSVMSNKQAEHLPNHARGKKGRVAWLSNSCHSHSLRELFVRELQRYMPVDVYGLCGPMSCHNYRNDDCLRHIIQKKYKFFLSLEESFCKGLISQNVWKIYNLRLAVVPIVLGSANYSSYYPDGTFIDAKRFDSVHKLARYLQFVDKNDHIYNQYISNRGRLACGYTTNYNNYLCQLCRHLHNFRRQKESIADVSQFWGVADNCEEASHFYERNYASSVSANPWWKPS